MYHPQIYNTAFFSAAFTGVFCDQRIKIRIIKVSLVKVFSALWKLLGAKKPWYSELIKFSYTYGLFGFF